MKAAILVFGVAIGIAVLAVAVCLIRWRMEDAKTPFPKEGGGP